MKKLILSLFAIGASALAAQAAILVQPSGSGVITFPSRPPATDWASMSVQQVTGGDAIWGSAADVIAGVGALDATSITVQLVDAAGNANPGANNNGLWTSGGSSYIITKPTGNAGSVVKATVQNNSGADLNELRVMYTFGRLGAARTEQTAGQEVFYSFTGAPSTWIHIPELSGGPLTVTTLQRSNTITFASPWVAGQTMYFLWADDNSTGGGDDGYSIDDISFTPLNAGLSVSLSSPGSSQTIVASALNPASVQVLASPSGANPATSVSFYTNGVLFFTDTTSPYSNRLANLFPGAVVSVYAVAVNATETAFSATNTITVRDEFIHFTGSTLTENFDNLGANGVITDLGWYVGGAPPVNGLDLTVGDGSAAANANTFGWNYGTTGNSDRSLGTAATGGDRNIVARIQNNTANSISSFEFRYTGEVWRNYTNFQFGITNFVSFDQGGSWIDTGYFWLQPFAAVPGTVGPINGDDSANRVVNVGGVVTPPSPVPPNGVIYIRWYDNNEGGTDGGLAVDDFSFTATLGVFTPTLLITGPANGSSFGFAAPITITASPSMANPVTNVTFYDNNLSTMIGSDTTSPFSISVNNLSVGSHTLFAIAQDNSGARATNTATVTITINPNVPPSVTITNPVAPITDMLVGATVNVGAAPTDPDGAIAGVEFYVNGVRRGTNDITSAYSMEIGNLTLGANLISAVAIDNAGGRGTNSITITTTNAPGVTSLVTNGSDWKYYDLGTDPGATWTEYDYNDAGWLTGIAELGYGDANGRPEVTVINGGVDPTRFAATYFRKKFNVANPAAISSLTLRIMKDDHAVVYLNGTKIFSDMTNAVITFQTYEGPAVTGDGAVYEISNNIPSTVLRTTNVIAVEVHQESGGSSDVSFDLMLWGESGGPTGPRLTITQINATQATISWGADAAGYTLYGGPSVPFALPAWTTIGGVIAGADSTTVNTTGDKFFILRNP